MLGFREIARQTKSIDIPGYDNFFDSSSTPKEQPAWRIRIFCFTFNQKTTYSIGNFFILQLDQQSHRNVWITFFGKNINKFFQGVFKVENVHR